MSRAVALIHKISLVNGFINAPCSYWFCILQLTKRNIVFDSHPVSLLALLDADNQLCIQYGRYLKIPRTHQNHYHVSYLTPK